MKRLHVIGTIAACITFAIVGVYANHGNQQSTCSEVQSQKPDRTAMFQNSRPVKHITKASVNQEALAMYPMVKKESLSRRFEDAACEQLDLTAARIYDPDLAIDDGPTRPNRIGEVWIRMGAEDPDNLTGTMEKVAELYHMTVEAVSPVNVILWVGGHPHFQKRFHPSLLAQKKSTLSQISTSKDEIR